MAPACAPGASPFVERWFGDCLYDRRDALGFAAGLASIACWMVAQVGVLGRGGPGVALTRAAAAWRAEGGLAPRPAASTPHQPPPSPTPPPSPREQSPLVSHAVLSGGGHEGGVLLGRPLAGGLLAPGLDVPGTGSGRAGAGVGGQPSDASCARAPHLPGVSGEVSPSARSQGSWAWHAKCKRLRNNANIHKLTQINAFHPALTGKSRRLDF